MHIAKQKETEFGINIEKWTIDFITVDIKQGMLNVEIGGYTESGTRPVETIKKTLNLDDFDSKLVAPMYEYLYQKILTDVPVIANGKISIEEK